MVRWWFYLKKKNPNSYQYEYQLLIPSPNWGGAAHTGHSEWSKFQGKAMKNVINFAELLSRVHANGSVLT